MQSIGSRCWLSAADPWINYSIILIFILNSTIFWVYVVVLAKVKP